MTLCNRVPPPPVRFNLLRRRSFVFLSSLCLTLLLQFTSGRFYGLCHQCFSFFLFRPSRQDLCRTIRHVPTLLGLLLLPIHNKKKLVCSPRMSACVHDVPIQRFNNSLKLPQQSGQHFTTIHHCVFRFLSIDFLTRHHGSFPHSSSTTFVLRRFSTYLSNICFTSCGHKHLQSTFSSSMISVSHLGHSIFKPCSADALHQRVLSLSAT